MTNQTSYAQVTPEFVLTRCEAVFRYLKRQREVKFEEKVQRLMKVDQRGFWARRFGKPAWYLTHEQATQRLKCSDGFGFSEYQWTQMHYDDVENRVSKLNRLARMARANTLYVYVSAEDMNMLTYDL